ncbi:hypothetical protein WISP_77261 [Willisornis vidua]|uniref:Uncharacterized protein n=1 Tax=Willisornis vidua TaxID=1566151 RepID=A0ABQ9DAI0_9PASS|nr:hypothetical protein WISP_77261 [Willisornis vidua]
MGREGCGQWLEDVSKGQGSLVAPQSHGCLTPQGSYPDRVTQQQGRTLSSIRIGTSDLSCISQVGNMGTDPGLGDAWTQFSQTKPEVKFGSVSTRFNQLNMCLHSPTNTKSNPKVVTGMKCQTGPVTEVLLRVLQDAVTPPASLLRMGL